jgi:predicted dehydrogenase
MTAPLRIGVAGAGWVSAYHLTAWRQLRARAEVVAIADPDTAAAARRAAEHDIANVHDSVERMLEAHALDAIDVAAPREEHAAICRQAASRGIAILCQKPLAPTLQEAEALVADVADRVRLMVHDNWRFRPHYRRVGEWLAAARIGDIRTITMSVLTSGLLPDRTGALPALVRQPMLMTLDRMLLMEVLIHHLDTLRFLLGPLTLVGSQLGKSCAAIAGEDRAALFLTTAAGAALTLVGDFMAHGHPPQAFDRLEILGTRGAIVLERDRLRLLGAGGVVEEVTIDLAADYQASYLAALTHFVDRLDDGGRFETSTAEHLATLRIVEAAY